MKKFLLSPLCTLWLFALAIFLLWIGSLAQASMSNLEAINWAFYSFFLTKGGLPIFIGGASLSLLFALHFLIFFMVRLPLKLKNLGLWILHIALMGMLLQFAIEQFTKEEGQVFLSPGKPANFALSPTHYELLISDNSHPSYDQINSLDLQDLKIGASYSLPSLDLKLHIVDKFDDAVLLFAPPPQGISHRLDTQPPSYLQKRQLSKDQKNPALILELQQLSSQKNLGTLSFHSSLPQVKSLATHGLPFLLKMQRRQSFFPFSLNLLQFKKELYPHSNTPKSFSSLVEVYNEENQVERQSLIYMNHPLKIASHTFYQASYSLDEQNSILQWVHYPYSWTPYTFCILMLVGLALHLFRDHLSNLLARRNNEQ